ncbi:hypothetical protein KUV57_12465 [Epibacterium sp. DP7N7-1]|nr:hypothetical protein [Epibacterium sp. DP7N7-1]
MKDATKEKEFAQDFEADVPEHLQNDVLTQIVEAIWDPDRKDEDVNIFDIDEINMLNRYATGSIMIEGREHVFEIRDGNNNGTEVISWNKNTELSPPERVIQALVPQSGEIESAIRYGRALKFLEKWNSDLKPGTPSGNVLHDLLQRLGSHRYTDCGVGAQKFFAEAREHGYDILEEADAVAARRRLHLSAYTIRPDILSMRDETPRATLERWNDALNPESECCAEVRAVFERMADRLSQTSKVTPTSEEYQDLKQLGFVFIEPGKAQFTRMELLLQTFKLEPIEDFDPDTLPENPVKELFKFLDPSLVSSTKVNPLYEASRYMHRACEALSGGTGLELPAETVAKLATVGYRAVRKQEPDPELSPSP